jgi:hypothetical protein
MMNRQEPSKLTSLLKRSNPLNMISLHMTYVTNREILQMETRNYEIGIVLVSVAGTIMMFDEVTCLCGAVSSVSTRISVPN